ncbi:SWFGD domain-containing protein [Aurantiacibacter aquimixticola]|uniref:SWFGD domain-containing protein n=2 Tax=Aurantiacibacter aquimixticola TaxID=1958945 RepID=A0A419RX07_9SPHN|nr:SWFGD domain-containing protein [Aurantiacibacter aquimixticola]
MYRERDDEYSDRFDRDFQRGRGRRKTAMPSRARSDYNPLDQYDRDATGFERSGERANHGYFRGDSYGGQEPLAGPEQMTGGGSFWPQDTYSRRSTNRDERGFFDKAGDEIASWFGDEDAERRREMDNRGRGPSNYRRSDERILEDSCDRLTDDRGVDATDIQVTVSDREVTLDGKVNTRWEKRRAEDCIYDVSGVDHVQNNLRLHQTDMRSGKEQISES